MDSGAIYALGLTAFQSNHAGTGASAGVGTGAGAGSLLVAETTLLF